MNIASPAMSLNEELDESLRQLEGIQRYRRMKEVEAIHRDRIRIEGRNLINFASNNYLGLSDHWRLKCSAILAAMKWGVGARASRLLAGNSAEHQELEARLAQLKGTGRSLVFPTGYMANLAVITALMGPDDLMILDRLNHASLFDAARLSGGKIWVYPHRDLIRLESLLSRAMHHSYRRIMVITESLFSMEGDIAPIPEILKLCERRGALLLIDEAHSTGVLGKTGRGVMEHFGVSPSYENLILMGTLSKALGALGGFIAGSESLVEYLINHARTFIFTTALPHSICRAARTAVEMLMNHQSPIDRLHENISYCHRILSEIGLKSMGDETPIIPIMVGSDAKTLELSQLLYGSGYYVPAIRPPTVKEGKGRLRVSLTATHKKGDIVQLLDTVKRLAKDKLLLHQ